jgi:hypothetical protein
LIDLLHERALLEGRDFGVRIEPNAYEFVVYDTHRDAWLKCSTRKASFGTATCPRA